MKQTLVTGLLLLGVVLGLNAAARVRPTHEDTTAEKGVERANSVRIYSCASWLEPERFIVAPTPIAVIIDGEFRAGPIEEPGLRVIAIDRGRVGELHSFNLAHSSEAIDSFGEFCEQTRRGTVLAMGVHQVASPPLDDTSDRRDRLDAVFRRLGARLPPTENPRASWAYLCVRGDNGWKPIAEAQSPTRGVSLARMLSIDPADLEAIQPTLMIDNQREISLIRWFDRATYVTEAFTQLRRPDNSITGGSLDSIFAQPPYGDKARLLDHDDNRLAWDGFQIPQQATFITQLGISYWARAKSDGVIYHLFIDGEEIASRALGTRPSDLETWVTWKVDLSRFAGRTVRLELRVSANGTTYSDLSVWGDPKIVFPRVSEDQPVGAGAAPAGVLAYFTRPEADPPYSPPALGLARAISTARDEILLCMFRFDHVEVLDALIAAHERGVTVRVLTDEDFWTTRYAPTYDTIRAAGIEVRTDRVSLDTVLHNKYSVIDSAAVWTGDWNAHTLDSYKSHHAALYISNADLAAIYSSAFELLWDGDPLATLARRHAEPGQTAFGQRGETYTVYFPPGDSGVDVLREAIATAQERVWMAHSYVSNRAVIAELIEARERGVDVRVLYQSTPIRYDAAMALNGIDVRNSPYNQGCKFLAIDGRHLIIGSWNLGAQETDIENLLVIRDLPELIVAFEQYFSQIHEASKPYFTASVSQLLSGPSDASAVQELSFRPMFEDDSGKVALERLRIARAGDDDRIEAVFSLNNPDAQYVVDYSLSPPLSKYGPILDKRNAPLLLDTSALKDGMVTAAFAFEEPANKYAMAIIRITRLDGPRRKIVAKYAARLESLQ